MKNIFKDIPEELPEEFLEKISGKDSVTPRIERIISRGHASPPDFWYDQENNEFVILLKGKAGLRIKDQDKILEMTSGDYIDIPAHTLHRIEWTSSNEDTIWLSVHY